MGKPDLKRSHGADDGTGESYSKLSKKSGKSDVSSSKVARQGSGNHAPLKGQDMDGNFYWELSKMRRVGISHFKSSTLVNIREYYENAGQMRPGKKGISLSLDQYKMLIRAIPHINIELRNDGIAISSEDESEAVAEETDEKVPKEEKKKEQAPKKANFEATSDEDSS